MIAHPTATLHPFLWAEPLPTAESESAGNPLWAFRRTTAGKCDSVLPVGPKGKSARVFWEIFSSLIKDTCTREPPSHSCLRSYHVRSWGLELCTHLVTMRESQPGSTELPNSSAGNCPALGFLLCEMITSPHYLNLFWSGLLRLAIKGNWGNVISCSFCSRRQDNCTIYFRNISTEHG